MRTKILLTAMPLFCGTLSAQTFEAGQGTYLRLGRGTQMSVNTANIGIEGNLRCDTGAVFAIGGRDFQARLYSPRPLLFSTLRIDGNAAIDAAEVDIAGDIAMNTGILNLGNASVRLHGNIVNENEGGYITGGRIAKTLSIKAGQWINTGMGVSFIAGVDYDTLLLMRLHERQRHRSEQSISKGYEFENAVSLMDIDFAYLNAFAQKPAETYLLYYQGFAQVWESIDALTNTGAKRVIAKLPVPIDIQRIALFPFPELNFTKFLTPNGDGVNDYFEVYAIEKYADNKLVILHPDGKIIYEKTEYANDFNGDGMGDGTYYFMFFGSRKDRSPLKKGFFELKRE